MLKINPLIVLHRCDSPGFEGDFHGYTDNRSSGGIQLSAKPIEYDPDIYDCSTVIPSTTAFFGFDESQESRKELNELNAYIITMNENEQDAVGSELQDFTLEVGQVVEMKHEGFGAWFRVTIEMTHYDDTLQKHVYTGRWTRDDGNTVENLNITEISATQEFIRPLIQTPIKLKDVRAGDIIKVRYTVYQNTSLWYDSVVKSLSFHRPRHIIADITIGRDGEKLSNCKITSTNDLFIVSGLKGVKGEIQCETCFDRVDQPCIACSCKCCGGKDSPSQILLCDECNQGYHIWCLEPKLDAVPQDNEWFCSDCTIDRNEIVQAGEGLRLSKKKKNMKSYKNKNAEWGKGMACAGRSKECTLVPKNHVGAVPGVEVGTAWSFRITVAEYGIHRAIVSGIHGRQDEGAFSIVLSGGYEDDVDNGDTFIYTGSGGRDLSGNKRTNVQCTDQKLELSNLALARNCNAPINKISGARAVNWRKGIPVRVLRSGKQNKVRGTPHSIYAPEEGYRYDGVYKVVRYYPEKGKSGYIIWRFELKRDDPTPAPWTPAGKAHIKKHHLEKPIAPAWFEQDRELKKEQRKKKREERKKLLDKKKKSAKTKLTKKSQNESSPSPSPKKVKYNLEKRLDSLIQKDTRNAKLWTDCKDFCKQGKQSFLEEVQSTFICICCQELVYKPITTPCKHTFCQNCMRRAFDADVKTCPSCRNDLSELKFKVNATLQKILLSLFPGYSGGRD